MKYLIIKNSKDKAFLISKYKTEEIGNSLQFLNDLCISHGSTYKGRIDGCKKLLNITQKAPLLISELSLDIMFPVLSANNKDNIWINYNEILSCHVVDSNKTLIYFKDGFKYEIPFNSRIIKKQITRCEELIEKLNLK